MDSTEASGSMSWRQSSDASSSTARLKSHAPAAAHPSAATTRRPSTATTPSHDGCAHRLDKRLPAMAISTSRKVAGHTIAPFLAKHIPEQYAPLGLDTDDPLDEGNTKYCYRHRPDLKCRRSADEMEMETLQRNLESLPRADQQGIAHVWSVFSAAPAKHRTLMLQGILTQCCFPQLSYLSNAVRDLIRIDFVSALPAEVAFKILCYLDTTSLCKAAQVSQRWRAMADDDVVWHKMCEQHIERKCTKCGLGLPLLERKRLRDWKRQQQLRASGRGINKWSPELTPAPDMSHIPLTLDLAPPSKRPAPDEESEEPKRLCVDSISGQNSDAGDASLEARKFRPWKDVYKDRFKVSNNWKHGRCVVRVFRGHTNGVMCLQFVDSVLATGSYDSTIKIWNADTGREVRTLRGHTSGIRALQFDETKLISGSLDKTIKVWNWRTGECVSTLEGHADGIVGLHFNGNLLASGSIDKTIKIWNFQDKSTFSLRGHKDWVNAVRLDTASHTVFSASDDCTVKMWDLDAKQCIRTFEGHVGQVQQLVLLPHEFEPSLNTDDADEATSSASVNEVGDLPTPEMYGEVFKDGRPLPPRYMLTSALDSTVRLWDIATGTCIKTMFGHVEGVWALAADSLRIVSGAEDRMVKVWDARTGKYERTFTGPVGPVTCIGLSDSRMCTGSEDHLVRMYSFRAEEFEDENGEPLVAVPSSSGSES